MTVELFLTGEVGKHGLGGLFLELDQPVLHDDEVRGDGSRISVFLHPEKAFVL